MSHTPGPWEAAFGEVYSLSVGQDDCVVAEYYGPDANGHLMAAAPDLLAACEELLIYLGDWDDPDNETCVSARDAVRRARGLTKEGITHGEDRRVD